MELTIFIVRYTAHEIFVKTRFPRWRITLPTSNDENFMLHSGATHKHFPTKKPRSYKIAKKPSNWQM